jgi:hypothetical protein
MRFIIKIIHSKQFLTPPDKITNQIIIVIYQVTFISWEWEIRLSIRNLMKTQIHLIRKIIVAEEDSKIKD